MDPKATRNCKICEEAVKKFGHEAHLSFQSVGRKGSGVVLTEMGEDARDMAASVQIAMIDVFPNLKLASWKSQMQELFEDRGHGHFFLVGAACQAELASREHGWTSKGPYLGFPNRDMTPVTLIAHHLTWRLHLPYLACSSHCLI